MTILVLGIFQNIIMPTKILHQCLLPLNLQLHTKINILTSYFKLWFSVWIECKRLIIDIK